MKTVYVVGLDGSVESLFEERGWKVHAGDIPNISVDLIVFTGGSDIDPEWYGEENLGSHVSEYSRRRDKFEFGVYEWANELGLPKAGICRGGQLFNIANGGKMIQHIDGHGYGNHSVYSRGIDGHFSNYLGTVNSCHHQQMIPSDVEGHEILAATHGGEVPEVIFYSKNKDLCFQAHPEWGHGNTANLFFNYINTCLGM